MSQYPSSKLSLMNIFEIFHKTITVIDSLSKLKNFVHDLLNSKSLISYYMHVRLKWYGKIVQLLSYFIPVACSLGF